MTITTSSPDGDDETSIRWLIIKEGNKINYTGKVELSTQLINLPKMD
jgi:hypothetical protein